MDEMDYDMSDSSLDHAPSTAPHCPALLPNLSRPTISGSAYDPVHSTSNRSQDLQTRHGLSATAAPLPFYPDSHLQQESRDRQRPSNTSDEHPRPYPGSFNVQPPAARPGMPISPQFGTNVPQETSDRSSASQRTPGSASLSGPQPAGDAPWARSHSSNMPFQRQHPPRPSLMSLQIGGPLYNTTMRGWPGTSAPTSTPDEDGERIIQYPIRRIDREQQDFQWLEHQWRDDAGRHADQQQPSTGAQLPRFATMLNTAWQQPEEEYVMTLNTAGRVSPSPSQSPSSFASSSSESVASRDNIPSEQSTAAAAAAAPPSSEAASSTAPQQRSSSPNLSHTTLDRTFWEAASGPPAERESTDVSASSSPAGNQSETSQPRNDRGTPPRLIPGRHPSQTASVGSNNFRRARVSPGHRRSAHSSGGSSRSSDQDSDGSLDANFASLIEDPTIHNFLGHFHGNGVFTPGYGHSNMPSGVRARQMLRGATSNRRVASKGAIASLVCVDIESLPETERTCIICYNDFGVRSPEGINEAPLRLPKCKHVFGDHCIKKWFEESDSCPYCRDKVPSEPQFRTNPSASQLQQLIRAQQQLSQHGASRAMSPQIASYPTIFLGHPQTYVRPTHRERDGPMLDPTSPPFPGNAPGRSRGPGDRRAPPEDSNEGQRRTRARHGNFRTSAGRSFMAANNSLAGHHHHAHHIPNSGNSFSRHGPSQSQPTVPTMPTVSYRSIPPSISQPSIMHMAPLPAPTNGGPGGSHERCMNMQYNRAHSSYMWQPSSLYAPSYAAEHPFSVSMSPYGGASPYNMAPGQNCPPTGPGGAMNRGGYGLQPPTFNSSGPSENNMPFGHPVVSGGPGGPGGLPCPFAGNLHNRMAAGQPSGGVGAGQGAGPSVGPNGLGLSMQQQVVSPPSQTMPTIDSLSNSPSSPLASHPLLPPIIRDETMNRYMNAASNTQDNSLPAVTTGWGPS